MTKKTLPVLVETSPPFVQFLAVGTVPGMVFHCTCLNERDFGFLMKSRGTAFATRALVQNFTMRSCSFWPGLFASMRVDANAMTNAISEAAAASLRNFFFMIRLISLLMVKSRNLSSSSCWKLVRRCGYTGHEVPACVLHLSMCVPHSLRIGCLA